MKIVIVGDGKVGFALTQQLAREDHDIVVIDSNKMVLKESQQMVDIQVVHGNGASPVVPVSYTHLTLPTKRIV